MSHNTLKFNGIVDPNYSAGAPTYIPGDFSPTPLFNIGTYFPSGGEDGFLVDCLYTIHGIDGNISEVSYTSRYIITYRVQGINVYWDSQQQLFEFSDCNGTYTPPNHLFIANSWSDGIVLLPDTWLNIGRVMYDINVIIQ